MLAGFFKDSFFLALTTLLVQLKGIALIPLLTKKFGAIGYGSWSQVTVLVAILVPLVGLGIESGFGRFAPAEKAEERLRMLWSMVWWLTLGSGCGALGLYLLSGPLTGLLMGSEGNRDLILVAGLVVYANVLINAARAYFRAIKETGTINYFMILQGFGNLGTILLVFLWGGGVTAIVGAGALFDLLLAVFFLAKVARVHGFSRPRWSHVKRFIGFGWVLLPTMYATWVINLSDRIFVVNYHSLEAVGIYSVAHVMGYVPIMFIFNPIWYYFQPTAVKAWESGEKSEIDRLFQSSLKVALGLIVLAAVLLTLLYRPLTLMIASAEVMIGPWVMLLITLAYTASMIGSYPDTVLRLLLKQRYSTYIAVATAGLNVVLNWVLIPGLGILGAALATAGAMLFQAVTLILICGRYHRLTFPAGFFLKTTGAGLALVWLARVLGIEPSGIFDMVTIALGVFLAYGLAVVGLGAVSPAQLRTAGRFGINYLTKKNG